MAVAGRAGALGILFIWVGIVATLKKARTWAWDEFNSRGRRAVTARTFVIVERNRGMRS